MVLIVENQGEKNMEHEMETGLVEVVYRRVGSWVFIIIMLLVSVHRVLEEYVLKRIDARLDTSLIDLEAYYRSDRWT